MSALEDIRIHVRLKLSALWASTVFCYLYGDYFELYVPGKLQAMLDGRMGPLGHVTQGILIGTTILLAVPSVMVFLSLVLKAGWCRWINIVLGSLYSLVMLAAIQGTWNFYVLLGIVEIVLTLLIVRYAWTWPRVDTGRAAT